MQRELLYQILKERFWSYSNKTPVLIITLCNIIIMKTGKKKVDQYEIDLSKRLGQGSYGQVYIAYDTNHNRMKKAVKIIPKNKINANVYMTMAFQKQIQIMASLQSPGIVRYYDVIESTNNYYVVMEYCEGGDFRGLLKKYPNGLPIHRAIQFITKILKGLQILAQKGITHRDLKPQNILIHQDSLKICDFGFAKASENNYLTSVVGSPAYMSPQIIKKEKYTYKCDIWSLGIIIHQILYGKRPIPDGLPTGKILQYILSQPFKYAPLKQSEQQSSKIILFMDKCLQIEQANRFSWEDIYSHHLFKDQVGSIGNLKLGYILSALRLSIHFDNIDLNKIFQKYSKTLLNEHQFLIILKSLSEDITASDVSYLMSLYGRKRYLNNQILIDIADLKSVFEESEIRTTSLSINDVIVLQSTLQKHITSAKKQKGQHIVQQTNIKTQVKIFQATINQIKRKIQEKGLNLEKLYEQFDRDKNNEIDRSQFSELLNKIDNNLQKESCMKIFDIFDMNRNGFVSFRQFYKTLCQISGEPQRSHLK